MWQRLEQDLKRALSGELALETRLAERAEIYASTQQPRRRRPIPLAVFVDNTASVIEVRGPDTFGFLYRVTRALLELQLDVSHAKAATLGTEVIDSFYVVGRNGHKLTDHARIQELERMVRFELASLGIRHGP